MAVGEGVGVFKTFLAHRIFIYILYNVVHIARHIAYTVLSRHLFLVLHILRCTGRIYPSRVVIISSRYMHVKYNTHLYSIYIYIRCCSSTYIPTRRTSFASLHALSSSDGIEMSVRRRTRPGGTTEWDIIKKNYHERNNISTGGKRECPKKKVSVHHAATSQLPSRPVFATTVSIFFFSRRFSLSFSARCSCILWRKPIMLLYVPKQISFLTHTYNYAYIISIMTSFVWKSSVYVHFYYNASSRVTFVFSVTITYTGIVACRHILTI